MKNLGEASFVLGIEVHRERRKEVLRLSQKTYLEEILKKYSMHASKSMLASIVKGNGFGKSQYPRNQEVID
jgi:ABC-type histidine transport system ATPase subunit